MRRSLNCDYYLYGPTDLLAVSTDPDSFVTLGLNPDQNQNGTGPEWCFRRVLNGRCALPRANPSGCFTICADAGPMVSGSRRRLYIGPYFVYRFRADGALRNRTGVLSAGIAAKPITPTTAMRLSDSGAPAWY